MFFTKCRLHIFAEQSRELDWRGGGGEAVPAEAGSRGRDQGGQEGQRGQDQRIRKSVEIYLPIGKEWKFIYQKERNGKIFLNKKGMEIFYKKLKHSVERKKIEKEYFCR